MSNFLNKLIDELDINDVDDNKKLEPIQYVNMTKNAVPINVPS